MTAKPNDRRRAPRASVLMSVEFETAGARQGVQTLDISRTGVFLGTKAPMPVGTVLELNLGDSSTMKVRVARVVEADIASQRSPGMGCAILEADAVARAALLGQLALAPPPKAKGASPGGRWPTPVPIQRRAPIEALIAQVRVVSTPGGGIATSTATGTATAAAPSPGGVVGQTAGDAGKQKKDKKKGKGGKRDLFGDKSE